MSKEKQLSYNQLFSCGNCMDFNEKENTCEIRFVIQKDKTRIPMKRKASQKGCKGFMSK